MNEFNLKKKNPIYDSKTKWKIVCFSFLIMLFNQLSINKCSKITGENFKPWVIIKTKQDKEKLSSVHLFIFFKHRTSVRGRESQQTNFDRSRLKLTSLVFPFCNKINVTSKSQ